MTRQRLVLISAGVALLLADLPLAAQQQPGTVTLPLGDYERLLDRAAHPPVKTEAPPIAATVASAVDRGRRSATVSCAARSSSRARCSRPAASRSRW